MAIGTFQTLPNEVIIEIVRLSETMALGALSACSKRFHFLIEPVLYSTFKTSIRTGALPRFIRTILRNPSLALHVKTFIWTYEPNICSNMEVLEEDCINMFQEAFSLAYDPNIGRGCWKYNYSILRIFRHSLEHCNWDALVALLLCFLPNLQEIRMVQYGDCYDGNELIETILDRAAKLQDAGQLSPFSFAKLCRVSLENHGYGAFPYRGMGLCQLLPYLALKSIDSISSHMVTDMEFSLVRLPSESNIYTLPLPAFDFSKTSLVLDHSFISSTALPAFFGLFRSLKCLRYDFKYDVEDADENEWNTDIIPGNIVAAISHLTDSLEELVLIQQKLREAIGNDSADETIPSFSEFQKLKRIEASAHILLGRHQRDGPVPKYRPNQIQQFTRLFPTCLEALVIKDCNVAVFDVMSEWLLHELPPNLAMIKLEIKDDTAMEPGDLGESSLEDLFLRRGVMFTCCAPSSTKYCQTCDKYLSME